MNMDEKNLRYFERYGQKFKGPKEARRFFEQAKAAHEMQMTREEAEDIVKRFKEAYPEFDLIILDG